MYFIGIVDTENISLDIKSLFLAGLEADISRKLYLMFGHGGHLENAPFSLVGHCLRGVPTLIFFQHNNKQNVINALNYALFLITKFGCK